MRDKYHIKKDKKVFLYPSQWNQFYSSLSDSQKPYFKIVINTGGRVNEIRNLTPKDINQERNLLTFRITKVRAKLKEKRPQPRTIIISKGFTSWLLRYIKSQKIKKDDSIITLSLTRINEITKEKLKEIGVESYMDFSSHNLRKTHGNWLKALGVDGTEIASRMGHDINTMLKHYVSANIFNAEDKILMMDILGEDVINRLRGQ